MEKHYPILEMKFESASARIPADLPSKINRSIQLNIKAVNCILDLVSIVTSLCDRLDSLEDKVEGGKSRC